MTPLDSTGSPDQTGSPTLADDQLRIRYLEVDTSNVADVLDDLGLPDQGLHPAFAPFPADGGRLAGPAFTIRGQMLPYATGGGDADKMQACAAISPGSVSVWSGGGEGVCFFGELIAIGMRERGCVGALVDGGIRDVAWLKGAGVPVFARYRTPIQSIGRWKVTGWDVPVSLPGATVNRVAVTPGDFILADDDGAIVIPAAVTGAVLERAEAMVAREREIRARLDEGMTLAAALQHFGHV
jgi:4-hydroxy-4-methyl-2-oxoglutarate aldolase